MVVVSVATQKKKKKKKKARATTQLVHVSLLLTKLLETSLKQERQDEIKTLAVFWRLFF